MSDIITIVGKGPSAIHAQRWIDEIPDSDVATINESGAILDELQPLRFCFFCHTCMIEKSRPLWSRIQCFVSPSVLLGGDDLPQDFPHHRRITYDGNECPAESDELRNVLNSGRVTHHHTVAAAMSWLAKIGYRHIRIIGVGGDGYAAGFEGQPWAMGGDWIDTELRLAELLAELYGVTVERFDQ